MHYAVDWQLGAVHEDQSAFRCSGRVVPPSKVRRLPDRLWRESDGCLQSLFGAQLPAVGETLQLDFKNTGQMRHEWVIGTPFEISEHLELMRRFPDMEHDEPHNVHVDPGQSRTLVWQFNREGRFEYACLLPGHYEAGMRGFAEVK